METALRAFHEGQLFLAADHGEIGRVIQFTQRLTPLGYHCGTAFCTRSKMAGIARVLSRATGIEIDVDTIQPVLIFCGAGLLFSILLMIYGVDLGASLF
jgi:hypothetical protein